MNKTNLKIGIAVFGFIYIYLFGVLSILIGGMAGVYLGLNCILVGSILGIISIRKKHEKKIKGRRTHEEKG